jgi:alpha-amylase
MAVIMGNGDAGTKWMDVGTPDTIYIDMTDAVTEPVMTNADGWGEFVCNGGSVSVWVPG